MYFYDCNLQLKRIPIERKISHPLNSHYVYKTSDGRCLKRFRIFPDEEPSLEFDQKLQSLNLCNFFTIDEYLFNSSSLYRAFLMPFYESRSSDVLFEDTNYITDNFESIFDSFLKLASARISAQDVNLENTIFTDDEIVIIDSEKYFENNDDDISSIRENNYQEASWLLFALLSSLGTCPEASKASFYKYFSTQDGKDVCDELRQYKYPIDYIRKVKQKIK